MVQHVFNLSILDTTGSGGIYKAPEIVPVSDPLGRLNVINTPTVGEETYLRDANDDISTIITVLEGGRYMIESFTRDSALNISHLSTTTSYWTSYI